MCSRHPLSSVATGSLSYLLADFSYVNDSLALFLRVPEDPLLTMGLEVPPAWVVVSKESVHDLDNIVLSKLSGSHRETGIRAIYELKNILIDGHARDVTQGNSPPRGVQIILGTERRPHMTDTIVMANLGYLQLKANPGVWSLDLKDGRSKEVFELESVGSEGWSSRDIQTMGSDVILTSFEGITIFPRVARKPGKETEDVLEVEEAGTGFVNQAEKMMKKWTGKFRASSKATKGGATQAEINIFSVASGHLYERFIYIMIQSVLKHTKSSVKFWFIENFLSPSFKVWHLLLFANERNLFPCSQRNWDLTTSLLLINGLIGFAGNERSSVRFGDIRYCSLTFCFPSIWTKSSLLMPTRFVVGVIPIQSRLCVQI